MSLKSRYVKQSGQCTNADGCDQMAQTKGECYRHFNREAARTRAREAGRDPLARRKSSDSQMNYARECKVKKEKERASNNRGFMRPIGTVEKKSTKCSIEGCMKKRIGLMCSRHTNAFDVHGPGADALKPHTFWCRGGLHWFTYHETKGETPWGCVEHPEKPKVKRDIKVIGVKFVARHGGIAKCVEKGLLEETTPHHFTFTDRGWSGLGA